MKLKHLAVAVIVVAIGLLLLPKARAEYVDLKQGGMIVAQPMRCDEGGHLLVCVLVDYQNKHYLVSLDQKGEYQMFLLENDVPTLIWSRDST